MSVEVLLAAFVLTVAVIAVYVLIFQPVKAGKADMDPERDE